MRIFTCLLYLCFSFHVFAQSGANAPFSVKGTVLEQGSSTPMEYCTVSLYSTKDSSLVTGTITDLDGLFTIGTKQKGSFYLKISYIGFNTKTVDNINLNTKNKPLELGSVFLSADAKQIKEVEVTAKRSTMRYQMDKKVISIDKNIASESGTAVDVLESTPSVQVSPDGSVQLRGNSNFLVLVDGKPTTLSGSEALQQIPAVNIKNIEIITNPSAKYAAGNTGGIINIILKQEKKIGTSGMVNISAGTFETYRGNVNIKHNVKKFSFEFSARTRNRKGPRSVNDSLFTSFNDEIYTKTTGERAWTFGGYSFNYGMGYAFAEGHKLNLDMVYGKWYMLADDERDLFRKNLTQNTTEQFHTVSDGYRGAPYFGPSLSYMGRFKNKSSLSLYVGYSQSDFSEKIINTNFAQDIIVESGSKTAETADNKRINAKVDFTLPIKKGKLELGAQSNNLFRTNKSKAYVLDTAAMAFRQTPYNNADVDFERAVYGIYATYGNKFKKFTYSLGLRAEYTHRKLVSNIEQKTYPYYKWNFFPTVHLGYNFDDSHQIYASYSSKINRPQIWQIEPAIIQTGANTYFQGDKDLKPNIINSVELGWAKTFKKGTRLSFEAYYTLYQDYREFIAVPYLDNATLTRPENVGRVQNVGLDASLNQDIFKWWNLELNGNAYLSIFDVSVQAKNRKRRTFEWNLNMNNYFTVTKTTKIQFSGSYNSRKSTALGYEGDRLAFGFGVKQSFFKRTLNLSLHARNIFNTVKDVNLSQRDNYYLKGTEKPAWPRINLSVTYRINNYRQNRRQTEANQGQL